MKFRKIFQKQIVLVSIVAALLFPTLGSADASQRIDVNHANAEQLASGLSGVGERLGVAIVKERESNGLFVSVDDLERVPGIGPSVVKKNRSRIQIKLPDPNSKDLSAADSSQTQTN